MKFFQRLLVAAFLVFSIGAGVSVLAASEPGLDAEPVVNINNASAEELAESLDGVGLSKARAIVESRDRLGGFKSAEDLARVKGLGLKTVEKNRARIRLQ